MILNNEREQTIYKQGYMTGYNVGQYANKIALEAAEHRAEVAERQARLLSEWLADKTRKNYPWQPLFDAAYKQSEKELAEEKKDGTDNR